MQTRLLSKEEFDATRSQPQRVNDGEPPADFWTYVESIPAEDFGVADCREGQVSHVYRMGDLYEHVLINSQYQGLAMVVVIDLNEKRVYGHYLLDINPVNTQVPES
ncbi:hypothetical protein [Bacterioplanoides sp. SCSIO 12839]|uniref:hypothetical protein n=1 Tax=Bacterioplanoides sp. SCSIO 12839 TaxID=2829569 RepID=UPI002102A1BA|nr:hypothetical protein [Bacterioplanoides sp. SCSIO 12839]UTW47333.1 hypothetical protein KFF03_12155 [Bacterioplanoides sp. SCSIO 12839]